MKGGEGGGPPQMWEVPPAALELPGLEGAASPSRQAKSTEKSNEKICTPCMRTMGCYARSVKV